MHNSILSQEDQRFCILRESNASDENTSAELHIDADFGKFRVTSSKDVYVEGDNSSGVLGVDPAENPWLPHPRFSKCLSELDLVSITCGNAHCLGLSKEGGVYTWGRNESGQCGYRVGGACSVSYQEGLGRVSQVACGFAHSLALTCSGEIFAWGLNSHGQLGTGCKVCERTPRRINTRSTPQCISAGALFSVYLDSGGLIWYTGKIPTFESGVSSFIAQLSLPLMIPRAIGNISVVHNKLFVTVNPEIVSIFPEAFFDTDSPQSFTVTVTSTLVNGFGFALISRAGGEATSLKILETTVNQKELLSNVQVIPEAYISAGTYTLICRTMRNNVLPTRCGALTILPQTILQDHVETLHLYSHESSVVHLEVSEIESVPHTLDFHALICADSGDFEIRTAALLSRNSLSFNSPIFDISSIEGLTLRLKICLGTSSIDPEIRVAFWGAKVSSVERDDTQTIIEIDVVSSMNGISSVLHGSAWRIKTSDGYILAEAEVSPIGSKIRLKIDNVNIVDEHCEVHVSTNGGDNWNQVPQFTKKEQFLGN